MEKYINQRVIVNQVQLSIAHTDLIDDQVTMNLQFASSANLVPMDYAALNIPANN